MEHITTNDEAAKDRLVKGLDSFRERGLDRKLFDLVPCCSHGQQLRNEPGWRLTAGVWGTRL